MKHYTTCHVHSECKVSSIYLLQESDYVWIEHQVSSYLDGQVIDATSLWMSPQLHLSFHCTP